MTEKKKLFVISGVTLAVYISIKYLLPYVSPFFFAWLLVRILNPWLQRIRSKIPWKKEVLMSILVFLSFLLTGFLIYLLFRAVMEQIWKMISNLDQYYAKACLLMDHCCISMERKTGWKASSVRLALTSGLESIQNQMQGRWLPQMVESSVQHLAGLVKIFGFVFMSYIAMLLLMKDYDRMREWAEQYSICQSAGRITNRMLSIAGAYLKSQILLMAVIILCCIFGLYVLGNPYALLLGLLMGLLDALPFLGTGILLLPWAAFLLIQGKYLQAVGYVSLFLITNGIREWLEPKLVGERIGVNPFLFALAVYAGFYLFGPMGVFAGPVSIILITEISREVMKTVKY